MKSLGVRRESIDETTFPEAWPLDDPALQELAASMREHGLLQPIGRDTDGKGIWGCRRWTAAKFILEWRQILTHTCEVEPGEDELIREVENIHRRDLPPMEREIALARLANRYKVREAAERGAAPESEVIPEGGSEENGIAIPFSPPVGEGKAGPGRGKKSAAAKAAEAAGVDKRTVNTAIATVSALSESEQRALSKYHATAAQVRDAAKLTGDARLQFIAGIVKNAKKAAAAEARDKTGEVEVPRDETGTGERLGNPLPPDVEATFRPTLVMCTKLRKQMKRALVEAQSVEDVWKKYHQPLRQKLNGRWSDLLANMHNVGAAALRVASHEVPNLISGIAAVEAGTPYALCPHCKGLPASRVSEGKVKGQRFGGMAECKTCLGFGWVREELYLKAAAAFRIYSPIAGEDGEELYPMVYVNNHAVKITALEPIEEVAA